MGPGKSYTELILRSIQLNGSGPKDKDRAREVLLKGLVDDVMLHHHGTCDIYQAFGDAVYITIPATVICNTRTTVVVSCATNHITVVTKADGLSNTLRVQKGQWR